MKRISLLVLLMLALCPALPAQASPAIARMQFEDAELAYSEKNYAKALAKLAEAESSLGRLNPPMLHLRIVARYDLIQGDSFYAFAELEGLRRDCTRYLEENAQNQALMDQMREVFRISEQAKSWPANRTDYVSVMEKQLRTLYHANRAAAADAQLAKLAAAMPEEQARWNTVAAEARAVWQQRQAGYLQRATPEMIAVPAGTSQIGGYFDFSMPIRKITFRPFAISKFEITFDQYDAFAEATNRKKPDAPWGRGRMPVVNVTHQDAVAFAEWLKASTGMNWRLLSEAEWEYTARAGKKRPQTGYFVCTVGRIAQRDGLCGNDPKPVPVGSYPPDSWMHDALGNVQEHVADCWHENYQGAPADQSPWVSGDCSKRVLRGGYFLSFNREMAPVMRYWMPLGYVGKHIGFRVGYDM